jgi:Fe-S-cluster-containing hydrogenase component 2
MLMFYFSGTGNSKYIAELFCKNINAESHPTKCYSVEDNIDFSRLMAPEDTIAFCYPVYGSRVPRIMREFASRYMEFLKDKKVIIFCTQMLFSGDGARAFTDIFPHNFFNVIYAEHFFMPNNVCNFFIVPLASERQIKKYVIKAERKMQSVCRNITRGIEKKRGFNAISRILGLSQGVFMPRLEREALDSVRINSDCTLCALCVSICPMNNLQCENGDIVHQSNCILCYRCINKCPQKAITVFFPWKVKKQYKGVGFIEQKNL